MIACAGKKVEKDINMSRSDSLEEILKFKQTQRATLRAQYWKEMTNPHRHGTGEGGTIFDPAIQRYISTRGAQYDYFKSNWKTAKFGLFTTIIPMIVFYVAIKKERGDREAAIRRGDVAYKDRNFKYI